MTSESPKAQGKSLKRAVLTGSLLQGSDPVSSVSSWHEVSVEERGAIALLHIPPILPTHLIQRMGNLSQ